MTTTITKRADELKPGDVVILSGTRVVLMKHMGRTHDSEHIFRACRIGAAETDTRYFLEDGKESWEVEVPALTPAQQHAEELLTELRRAYQDAMDGFSPNCDTMKALLAKIDPPAPPTLEEALTFVNQLYLMGREGDPIVLERAGQLLDRARRSGVLKA